MPHFIVKSGENYLYHRRKERGRFSYEARAAWGPDVGQARVFTTRSAAANACPAMPSPGEVVEVTLSATPVTSVPVTLEPDYRELKEENDAFRYFLRELVRVDRFSFHEHHSVYNIPKDQLDDIVRREHAGLLGHFIMDPKHERLVERTEHKVEGRIRKGTEVVLVPIAALQTLAVALKSVHWKQMLG